MSISVSVGLNLGLNDTEYLKINMYTLKADHPNGVIGLDSKMFFRLRLVHFHSGLQKMNNRHGTLTVLKNNILVAVYTPGIEINREKVDGNVLEQH